MNWFRSISIISSLALVTAFSIADDGALGKKKGGNGGDSGKSSGGDSGKRSGGDSGKSSGGDSGKSSGGDTGRRSGGDSGRSSGGDSGKSSGGDTGKRSGGDSGKSTGGDSGKSSGGSGYGSWVDKNKSSGGDRSNGDKARDDKTGSGSGSKSSGNSGGGQSQDRNRDRDNGQSRGDDINLRGRSNGSDTGNRSTGGGNSNGSSGSTTNTGRMDGSWGNGRSSGSTSTIDSLNRRRSGSTTSSAVRYGSDNNRSRDSKGYQSSIGRAPIDVFSGSMKSQVRREDNVRSHPNYRIGYYHYNRDWRDDNWYGSFYVFAPSYEICVVSPFYYCTFMPPYVRRSNVVFVPVVNYLYPCDGYTYYWNQGRTYRYVRPSWYDSNSSSDLDKALSDLTYAFEENDRRSISRLIPSRGNVGIYLDERYDYSMNADDFFDLMVDNVTNAKTTRYEILNVRTYRNEVRVIARHEFEDYSGRRTTLYHTYRMVSNRNGYEIVEFGTSDFRPRD